MEYIRDGRAPIPKNEKTSKVMSAIRSKNTKPELTLRLMLCSEGLNKYRLHSKNIVGKPDIVLPKKKVALFVNGCFWHGCPYCKPKMPKTNIVFWRNKISTNKLRDKRNNRELKKSGWQPITVWACHLRDSRGRNRVMNRIHTALK